LTDRSDAPWGPEWDAQHALPYRNHDDWGLADARLERLSDGVFQLHPTGRLRAHIPKEMLIQW